MKFRLSIGFFVCSALAAIFWGCMPQSSPPKPFYYYTLDYPPPAITLGNVLPVVLRVERFSVSPPFNSQRIFYSEKGPERNAYAYQQWIAAPSDLLPFLVARDLRSTQAFKGVLTPDSNLAATHFLSGWVQEFLEIDSAATWHASLILNITLIDASQPDPTRRILMQQRYNAQALCRAKTPAALAEAMSAAMAEVSSALMRDVYKVLSDNTMNQ